MKKPLAVSPVKSTHSVMLFNRIPPSLPQRGFSLVELMIALAIGLLIMASVVTIYVNASRTSNTSAIESQMNEDGLIALNLIQQQIRMAGYSNFVDPTTATALNFTGAGVRGCSASAFYPNASVAQMFTAIADSDCAAASTYGDGIIVRYEADTSNTVPTAGGAPTNCLMNGAYTAVNSAAATYYIAENRYYVAGSNPSSLRCSAGSGDITNAANLPQTQPILDNVDQMVLSYGIAATNAATDTQIVTYMKAADIDSTFAADPVDKRWGRVISVKVCLLMRSSDPMKDIAATATYRDCNGTVQTLATPDGYLRRAFMTTATLRNRLIMTSRTRANES